MQQIQQQRVPSKPAQRRANRAVQGLHALPQGLYANYLTAYFGFYPVSFYSSDYFPLLPWLFLFWAGYYLHPLVGRKRMEPLRQSVCPPLGWLGRHSLVLYLLHQPVIFGVLTLVFTVPQLL